jgi:polyferredoxin
VAADAILLVHAAFVLFVVASLPAIWVGAALGWRWVRNPWFRGLHLAAIAFVVIETVLGYVCPLTIWEDALRGTSDERGFIARFVHSWLFWNWPPWVFNAIYIAFGLAVALTWFVLPPRKRREP